MDFELDNDKGGNARFTKLKGGTFCDSLRELARLLEQDKEQPLQAVLSVAFDGSGAVFWIGQGEVGGGPEQRTEMILRNLLESVASISVMHPELFLRVSEEVSDAMIEKFAEERRNKGGN